MRLVSICPSNTELLYALGVSDELIALDDYSDWPAAWQHLPRVGPDLNIDIEKVKSFKPDLVLASLSVPGMERNIDRLEREKIPYVVFNPKSLADIAADLIRLGNLLGKKKQGILVANRFLEEIDVIRQRIPKRPSPVRLYWEWWPKPVFTPGGKNWLTEVSHVVGAINVYEEANAESVQTDWEDVIQKKPDLALIVWTGIPLSRIKKQMITSRPPWQGQPLADETRVHILEEGWYCRPSPRLITGIKWLAHLLYPETFSVPDPDPL
jgi:iron complex transport system substrate-binding protein